MVIDNQHWKPAHIFPEHYLVSDKGEIYSLRSGKTLRPGKDKDGYLTCILCVNGERRTIKNHRLVATAFIPNPDEKPAIDHINGIKTDNRVDNLRWCNNKENSNNPLTLAKLRKNAIENLSKMYAASAKRNFGRKAVAVYKGGVLVGTFKTQREAARFTKSSEGDVSSCISGIHKQSKGYTFKRIGDKLCV